MTHRIGKTLSTLALGAALAATALSGPLVHAAQAAGASDTDQERAARWQEIAKSIFGDRQIAQTDSLVKIDAPARALDAALVPITLTMPNDGQIKAVSLIIDDNPAPYAAKFEFGPAADPAELKLRVRVNNYTDMHAVVETQDGKLYEAKQFVKASGGCSAPMGMSDEEAMKGMGDMRMKFAETQPGKPVEATLMIRHPNFSGMQMNQVTRDYTPARYIDKLTVSAGDRTVFTMTGDISIASNPVINFAFKPDGKPIQVAASDNQGGRWQHSFTPPGPTN
ncbi:sulfur Metabolism [Methylobacterium phyllosphaerae]|jgi:sulfur-oxidizing protein SoxY|uniref:Sulfur Metabolism n=3 Tax=Methylobacterium TaxID=407 RepID=A0AAE8L501_9HYPH|nr:MULTISPECIES: quinoprotein dehydrogenase-associated SoxYZ-like carrier [Methylobacterium]KOX59996.1 sulfur oxidation protein SoxZ [Streptomyces purpurogeneiscleroticus]AIQ90130.1 sulfur oxidation protein SoxZ [Methylobacterium oryzae CBMB20]APT30878.1 sulfur Metabolism [Methylobacterium phyllosphaerae]AWV17694.1 quinoprotein dehydrogenase-associated SoxYZ-like carrier [Methylobacterium sp. XJLW]SFG35564.1 sulfur-oxidizing protein SoxY [Methylobacterium phyllosphaerae]